MFSNIFACRRDGEFDEWQMTGSTPPRPPEYRGIRVIDCGLLSTPIYAVAEYTHLPSIHGEFGGLSTG